MQEYLIYAWDAIDKAAIERRLAARPRHFEGARELKKNGNFISGGAMIDDNGIMRGSMMVVRFASRQELDAWLSIEPYVTEKVWHKIDIHLFRVAFV